MLIFLTSLKKTLNNNQSQEAEHCRIQRLEAIKRANDLMYAQTDKMKGLKSQKLYADVIHYRVSQVETKKKQKEDEKIWAHQFHENILRTVAQGGAEEAAKAAKLREQRAVIAVARKEQVDEVRAKRAAEKAELDAIGEAMKRQAKQQLADDFEAQIQKQIRIAEGNAAMVVANEKLKAVRKQIIEQEAEASAAREAEKDIIEGRKKALKALEIRRFEKKQETRQKIIDAAVKQLAAKSNKDEAILEKQVAEGVEKQERAFADKAARLKKQQEDIHGSRQDMLENKRRIQEEVWEQEDRMVKMQAEANQREIQREKDKLNAAHENVVKLKNIQYQDGLKANRKKVEDRIIELEQAKMLRSIGGQDDDKFADICKAEIMRYASEGKPVYTLIRALETTQPALLAAKKSDKPSSRKKNSD